MFTAPCSGRGTVCLAALYLASSHCITAIMGAEKDFLNSDFPMYAAGGVALYAVYRAYVVGVAGIFGSDSVQWYLSCEQ